MAQTTFAGPVTSNAGFNSDDTLTATDLTTGSFNLTDFTVRPTTNWSGTVAALVGAANSRTAGVSGGTIIGCYAQTSMGASASTVITGLSTAVMGVVDMGASTNTGPTTNTNTGTKQFANRQAAQSAWLDVGRPRGNCGAGQTLCAKHGFCQPR